MSGLGVDTKDQLEQITNQLTRQLNSESTKFDRRLQTMNLNQKGNVNYLSRSHSSNLDFAMSDLSQEQLF